MAENSPPPSAIGLRNCTVFQDRSAIPNPPRARPAGSSRSSINPACLYWSRREDIQARTVKGRLSWTDRKYQAGTLRGCPNWFGSLLPEVQGTSSWFISWMLEQHEDQAQRVKRSSSAESRAEVI
ncbi:hypothetical protein F511_39790 [Dorcoceras hygrometricum]|uniref:Uncharacterized protein n=1 Tax=Dorcoceras hygrometricum TaxID=472368 RepID=A0A2Z7A7H3_9LAMI|nr:hypothetical protein F511_39790 [Dorcoceras hygrometricum]